LEAVRGVKTLTAFYDLAVGPVSFDFVVFAIKADMVRRARRMDRLHIVIVPHEAGVDNMFRDKRDLYDAPEMHWRLWNICIPAARLLRASVSLAPSREWAEYIGNDSAKAHRWPDDWDHQTLKNRHHLVGDIIEWHKAGQLVPKLRASEHANRAVQKWYQDHRIVTMTTRSTYMSERNSDIVAWEKAGAHIQSRGYALLRILDTSEALGKGRGYAELNIDLRMACYQNAALNLQANNGAASLCWFSEAPYVMFGANNNPNEWDGLFVKQGLPLGANWPWATRDQHLSYGRETADTIIERFEVWAGATN